MNILLVSATELEINPLLPKISHKYPELTITTLISGVGTMSTSYSLGKALAENTYDLVIQAGLAGTFHNFHQVECFWVKQEAFIDLAVYDEDKIRSLKIQGKLVQADGLMETSYQGNPHYSHIRKQLKLSEVRGITSNRIIIGKDARKKRLAYYQADVESMEGAVLFYICSKEVIPFISLRAISNEVGVRDKSLWKLSEAVDCLCDNLDKLLALLNEKNKI